MQTKLNSKGERVYVFDEYPDIEVRPEVITTGDVAEVVPASKKFRWLVKRLMHLLQIDEVNRVHSKWCQTPGPEFVKHLMVDDFKIPLQVDNAEVLDRFKEGAFITVSNHPFGALDGIMLIDLVGQHRPDFKVMVNMVLNHINGMRSNFIAVDAFASADPKKKAVSMQGIKQAIMQVRRGHPIGFFPAGAVSKIRPNLRIEDREWQPNIIRLISQLNVPVVPIFFHGRNSMTAHILGLIDWRLRTLRLPSEVFNKCGHTMHISVGSPISPEEQKLHQGSMEEFGEFLRQSTYKLKERK